MLIRVSGLLPFAVHCKKFNERRMWLLKYAVCIFFVHGKWQSRHSRTLRTIHARQTVIHDQNVAPILKNTSIISYKCGHVGQIPTLHVDAPPTTAKMKKFTNIYDTIDFDL